MFQKKKKHKYDYYYYLLYRIRHKNDFWIINETYDLNELLDHVRSIYNHKHKTRSFYEIYCIYRIKLPKNSNILVHKPFDKLIITKEYELLYCK